jgi:phosphatidylglycerol---prolipoprotein diacylglyceryl transferase
LVFLFWKKEAWKKEGLLFGLFLILLFTARFLVEFVKLGQTDRDETMFINTGQMLSIPFVLIGCYLFLRALSKKDTINS